MPQIANRYLVFPLLLSCMFPIVLFSLEENIGKGEKPENHIANFLGDLEMPPFPKLEGDLAEYSKTQVYKRSLILGIDDQRVYRSNTEFPNLYVEIGSGIKKPFQNIQFNNGKTSQLSSFIKEKGKGFTITIESDVLQIDEPLTIVSSDCHIDFNNAVIKADGLKEEFCIYIRESKNIFISGLNLKDLPSGIYITKSENIQIDNCCFTRIKGNPVIIEGPVRNFILSKNKFIESGRAAVIVDFDVTGGIIEDNIIDSGKGYSNHEAGILLTDKGIYNKDQKIQFPEKIYDRNKPPQKIAIMHNTITNNLSSGIYCDGGVLNHIVENRITGNSKEGVCLDSGSTGNIFFGNTVKYNGKRYAQTDRALEGDFVLGHGRLEDGTAAAKLPGLSIDNALYNFVLSNIIQDNYGGGVKMVRTGIQNVLALNTIINNNEGASNKFHFFGIEMGAAVPDVPCGDLDFMASSGNIITGNVIYGDHYAGIFLGDGSIQNQVYNNIIRGATNWAVESVKEQENRVSGNISNSKYLNIKLLQEEKKE